VRLNLLKVMDEQSTRSPDGEIAKEIAMAKTDRTTGVTVEGSVTTTDAESSTPPREEPPLYEADGARKRAKSQKRKKKHRTSAGLRDAERFGQHATRASSRLARAVSKGFRTYEKERERSARKRRDGAFRDLLENASLGLGATLRAASGVPYELARGTNTRGVRRQTRCVTGFLALPFRR
jgi:hypothetical protein